MSLAIGLDVSELRMGWAVVDYDTQTPLALGVEDLREKDGGWPEDQVIRAVRAVRERVVSLGREKEDVWVVGIESAYHGPNISRTIAHAGVVGMATATAQVTFGQHVTCYPLGADEWRATCGISNAGKREDKKAACLEWASSRIVWILPRGARLTEDMADALGIATACALMTERREAA